MEIKGIDMAAGLASVGDDEEIYNDILQIYYEDGVEMLEVLKKNLQYTDMKLFITHTHAMKSASKGIGADDVSERFKEMEFAGKDGDITKIEERFMSCLEAFEELLGNIKRYLDRNNGQEENEIEAVLKNMKAVLEDMDTDAFEGMLKQLEKSTADEELLGQLHEMQTAYEAFDFAQVISMIDEII